MALPKMFSLTLVVVMFMKHACLDELLQDPIFPPTLGVVNMQSGTFTIILHCLNILCMLPTLNKLASEVSYSESHFPVYIITTLNMKHIFLNNSLISPWTCKRLSYYKYTNISTSLRAVFYLSLSIFPPDVDKKFHVWSFFITLLSSDQWLNW